MNFNSGKKILKIKTTYTKLNFKRGAKIMDDPAFHLNRTLKKYINYKLNKNYSRENIITDKDRGDKKMLNKSSGFAPKLKDNSNTLNRANTVTNIFKNRKLFLTKKSSKFKKMNYSSKSKTNSGKKMFTSMSNNKINLNLNQHKVVINRKNKSLNKISKNKILEKNSSNSTKKYIRHSGSTGLSINDINQLQEKNNGIYPNNNYNSIYNNNLLLANDSTLEIKNLKKPMSTTTNKKNKFSRKYFTQNNYYNYTNIKDKDKKFSNFCLIKKMKIINNKMFKNNKYLDESDNKKIIDNNPINSSNIIIRDNNSNNQTDINKDNNILKYCYTISNIKHTPQKCNNNIIGINKNDNNFEYIKRIEFLENENRYLKEEINESKNKLLLLENKINKLLIEKNSIEKEECPKPTPYVKKYSMETLQNLPYNDININNSKVKIKQNESKIENNNLLDQITNENNNKKIMKNRFWHEIQRYAYQPPKNNKKKQKLGNLTKYKSSHYFKSNINTQNKNNVNRNQNIVCNNGTKNLWKKVSNIQQLVEKL